MFQSLLAILLITCWLQNGHTAPSGDSLHACRPQPDDRAMSPVVRVRTGGGEWATGVVVAQDRVITALHVVSGSEQVLAGIQGFDWPAEVVAESAKDDLALLSVRTFGIDPLPAATGPYTQAEPVWVVGYPLAGERQVSRGRYAGLRGDKVITTAHVDSGSSGGALIRCSSNGYGLAGVITGYLSASSREPRWPGSKPSLAVSVNAVNQLVQSAK